MGFKPCWVFREWPNVSLGGHNLDSKTLHFSQVLDGITTTIHHRVEYIELQKIKTRKFLSDQLFGLPFCK